ncbi:putative nitrogen fixation protein NifT [Roseospira marina]|uniref:Putative nitrogen fixation protein NifT n=1 Tax=Roseospira marina TaxID=140057 RepID=A0A5M6IHH1_9PROT|nr:putative nitrogen fixation protein NifT [Roseospira marina]KAA5607612.1 putative nitrogen fixation protein NifT [Roseospira marina]MBB4312192.1 nitrogen fixation protein NifT [Roseospira marina]MBB5085792.1 nitrogen fixation protein NifT [Roseospira marina]
MKITIRRGDGGYEAYVPKKDLEEAIVASEKPDLWGGWIELGNGWTFDLPEMASDTPLPLTLDARRTSTGE